MGEEGGGEEMRAGGGGREKVRNAQPARSIITTLPRTSTSRVQKKKKSPQARMRMSNTGSVGKGEEDGDT